MRLNDLLRVCVLLIVLQGSALPLWAFQRETRIPIMGCNKYFAASGDARFYVIRGDEKQKDREELVIEVKNIPLTPGTVLAVNVDDEQIGSIKLNAKRSGTLKLTSDFRKSIPSINPGTIVTITTIDGRTVMR